MADPPAGNDGPARAMFLPTHPYRQNSGGVVMESRYPESKGPSQRRPATPAARVQSHSGRSCAGQPRARPRPVRRRRTARLPTAREGGGQGSTPLLDPSHHPGDQRARAPRGCCLTPHASSERSRILRAERWSRAHRPGEFCTLARVGAGIKPTRSCLMRSGFSPYSLLSRHRTSPELQATASVEDEAGRVGAPRSLGARGRAEADTGSFRCPSNSS